VGNVSRREEARLKGGKKRHVSRGALQGGKNHEKHIFPKTAERLHAIARRKGKKHAEKLLPLYRAVYGTS
jgi:hypothetical protein